MAEERGIEELGCAEHVYRFAQALNVWRHPLWRESAVDDIDAYAAFVREQTDLKLGIEADFVAGREDHMATLLQGRDWDFVVGSVHFVGEHAVDHDGYEVYDHRSQRPDALWRRYFETLGEAARSGLFDILAHPDLVKLWGGRRPVPEGDLRRFYDLAMDGIAESQIAVEVSTAGLRKPVAELYPAPAFLEMCLDAGCPGRRAVERRARPRRRRARLREGAWRCSSVSASASSRCSSAVSGGWRRSGELRRRRRRRRADRAGLGLASLQGGAPADPRRRGRSRAPSSASTGTRTRTS